MEFTDQILRLINMVHNNNNNRIPIHHSYIGLVPIRPFKIIIPQVTLVNIGLVALTITSLHGTTITLSRSKKTFIN